MTENDAFNVPVGIPTRNPNFMEGLVSHMASISPAQSNTFDLNSQTRVLTEFPALAMLQGGHLGNIHTGFAVSDRTGIIESNDSIPRNVYSDALNSAFSSSLNCGYDGALGDMNDRWGFNKCLGLPEISGKAPERLGFQTFQLMGNTNPNGWIASQNANTSSSRYSSELSLGPPMGQPSIFLHGTSIMDQCSEVTTSGSERQFGSEISTSCNSKNLSLSFGSGKQVQLPQFLSGSRYLTVIQEILAEIVSYSLENLDQMNYPVGGNGNGSKMPFSSSFLGRGPASVGAFGDGRFGSPSDLILRGREVEEKKKQLLALLQMVDEQYNQCVDEIHTVISAFHAATELDPRLHARFSLQTISSLYKSLRERISKQILSMGAYFDKEERGIEEDMSFETSFIQKQWTLQQLRRKDHQLWRPQRGLPERSVSVLRAWMFQNFLHPYPKDAEKHVLAVKSGLTRSQVSNWFINARVRIWKPMIEEMYAEMNRGNGRRSDEEAKRNYPNQPMIDPRRFNMN